MDWLKLHFFVCIFVGVEVEAEIKWVGFCSSTPVCLLSTLYPSFLALLKLDEKGYTNAVA